MRILKEGHEVDLKATRPGPVQKAEAFVESYKVEAEQLNGCLCRKAEAVLKHLVFILYI